MKAEKKPSKTEGRDNKGRFAPGNKLGPGRPASFHSVAVKAAREAALNVGLPVLIQAASEGDTESAKTLCLLGIPKLKPTTILEPVQLAQAATLKEKGERILDAVANGEVTGETASVLIELLKALGDAEIRERLDALEQRAAEGKMGVLVTPGLLSPEAWIAEAQRTVNDEPQE